MPYNFYHAALVGHHGFNTFWNIVVQILRVYNLLALFAVPVVVMALVLLLVFRSRWRLLPLGIELAATALTFGLAAMVSPVSVWTRAQRGTLHKSST